MKSYKIIRWVVIAAIVLILGALAGWYYFLHTGENQTNAQSIARGYGSVAPSFNGSAGSTYQNVLSALGFSGGTPQTSTSSPLWQVSGTPTAGFGWSASTTDPTLYFVERSSGYVFEADTDEHSLIRLTDTLRPKIYAALVSQDGSVVERSLDDNGTPINFAGAASSNSAATSSPGGLVGEELPSGIESIADDPVSQTLYYTLANSSGVSLYSSDWANDNQKHLLDSPLQEWRLFALSDGSVFLLQDPLDGVEGYAYQVAKDGTLSAIAEGPGLTILPRASSSALIFGLSSGGTLSLYAQMSASASAAELSIQTVADKCAWAPGTVLIAYCGVPESIPSGQFLDDWYKGIVHTSDTVYEVDVSAASTTLVFDPVAAADAHLDIEDPQIDPTGQYLAFINATDGTLWVLRIAQ